jgi:hypothetical protein
VPAAGGGRAVVCGACGAAMDTRQHYCLECGERSGARDRNLERLLRRAQDPSPARSVDTAASPQVGTTASAPRAASPTALLSGLSELSLPSRPISALLVLAFVGFGVLLGSVAGSPVGDSLAASARPRVKLLLPAPASTATEAEETTSSAIEPPAAEAQETPPAATSQAPAAVTPAPAKHAPAGKREAGERGGSQPARKSPAAKLPAIKHVFVVMLSDEPYAATFGPESAAPYLSRTLEKRGTLLARFYAVAHEQLADEIALISGQGPTPATADNCPDYGDVAPATIGAEEQVAGEGCVYPPNVPTVLGQLEVKQLTWRAYVQGIDEGGGTPPACSHPALGQPDPSSAQSAGGGVYATFRNPFVYFSGLVESPACATDDVGLSQLDDDLSDPKRTPSVSYVVPDRCHDASPGPCPGGGPGGLPAADGLLEQVVPKILASPAYKQGGLLLITADEAPSSGQFADSSSCCGQPHFPNLPAPTGIAASLPPEGGGQVGALMLSPFVKGGEINQEPYDDFSLLRTIEDLFKLKHLGYAAAAHVNSFEPSLFTGRPARAGGTH